MDIICLVLSFYLIHKEISLSSFHSLIDIRSLLCSDVIGPIIVDHYIKTTWNYDHMVSVTYHISVSLRSY
jgi:hypothetical protein